MKIAVISDIHGNIPALTTVAEHIDQWQPDHVIVNGDIVNRGPNSRSALQFVQQRAAVEGWQLVRGNHEDYVLQFDDLTNVPESGPMYELHRFAYWSYRQLNGKLATLRRLPEAVQLFAPDGSEFRATHASMQGNRDGIYPRMSDDELVAKIGKPPAVFVTAHTHVPLLRTINETLVANVGAVGVPFDLDRRLSYGRFTWDAQQGWAAEIVRLPYDYEQIERDYVSTGFLEEAGPLAQLMLVELRKARGLVYRWAQRFQEAVLAGEISMEASVRAVLADADVRPFLGPPGWTL